MAAVVGGRMGTRLRVAAACALALLAAPAATAQEPRLAAGPSATGLSAVDNENLGIPPDTTGAIGPRHYVETVNVRIGVFDRETLAPVSALDANAFWGLPAQVQLVDPQLAWDEASGRFYYVMLSNDNLTEERSILIAWTRTDDPTDLEAGWCRERISTGKLFDDYPKLGFGDDHILIGTNLADLEERKILYSRIWAIAKPPAGSTDCGAPLAATKLPEKNRPLRDVGGRRSFTPVPAVPVGEGEGGYVVAAECLADDSGEGGEQCRHRARGITAWRVSGSAEEPRLRRLGEIPTPAFRLPDPVAQPGTGQTLDPLDGRLTQAVANADPRSGDATLVWTQHTVARKRGRAKVRWYALDPRRLEAARQGTVRDRRQAVFNAAIAPTLEGSGAVLNYNVGGRGLLPEIRASVAGRPRSEVTIAGSDAAMTGCGRGEACSWGDYAGASTDPERPDVVWGANQVTGPREESNVFGFSWRTHLFALRAPAISKGGPDAG